MIKRPIKNKMYVPEIFCLVVIVIELNKHRWFRYVWTHTHTHTYNFSIDFLTPRVQKPRSRTHAHNEKTENFPFPSKLFTLIQKIYYIYLSSPSSTGTINHLFVYFICDIAVYFLSVQINLKLKQKFPSRNRLHSDWEWVSLSYIYLYILINPKTKCGFKSFFH